ncbi:hypothetical protein [Arthrobacter bambusae]|uniref:DUF2188 domain-containing protein n=1 Tax=Arthrobacter bambusae TaxID=1338426 RepID=A0AAW8D9D8_9MICC|nr:hypothetical protein [Arthrobacter bambusae]MDP9903259.1 hypothetical protein [Arthrobacter bambusae]MDQ0128747.1 hypothetical protein [Arthrobacter bambusae]MDQ0180088.1 hypothetical protein [Arthrobacter bambusae]
MKEQRAVDRETMRKSRNARFAEHGYKWVLRAPDGTIVTPAEAERAIDEQQWGEVDPGDFF